MKRFTAPIGVQQGSKVMFADFADGGPMWTGKGERESRFTVRFEESFAQAPVMTVALSMWDIDSHSNARADLTAENITAEGFELVFRTWGDSRIARVRADWTAIGSLQDEEFWQLD